WLEDDRSEETKKWVIDQNKCTFDYLADIPYRSTIEDKLSNLQNYEKIGTPFKRGNSVYYFKNDGLQNQSVMYKKNEGGKDEVYLDPNQFSADGTTSLGATSFSEDGSILAYSISEGGSDWRKVIIIDAASKKQIEDTLYDIKFSGISWYKNEGFYYSSYDKPKGSHLSAKTDQHKLYYHKLGTPQSEDKVVFGASEAQKRRYVWGSVTEDGHYLFISAAISTSGNELYMMDLTEKDPKLVQILNHFDTDTYLLDNMGDKLYFVTNHKAPNNRVVVVNAADPSVKNWEDFIPETENVLNVTSGGGYIFATYMKDAISQVLQYSYEGKLMREIELPGIGTVSGFGGKRKQQTLYYSFTNYHTPGMSFSYDPVSGKSEVYWKPVVNFDASAYESKQVFYKSKDGTKVPMIITYKKGLKLDGKNPTILYGYGGFNVSLTPRFGVFSAAWMDLGGVYAVANLRGGGEYGKEWHDAGTKMQKQNVFDDFIAAGEWLIANKYTSSDYLAINGGSNGGLLVGAVMTQRPDLMKVAIPQVGVLDMLRYHTFTAGAGWAYDYGTAEDSKEMFEYLKAYSPVHNVAVGTQYPATLVTTGDHDDRVVPAHSFKFISELQAKQTGKNPVLVRIETNAGHGAGTPTSKRIAASADIISFILWNMGITSLN
ncbi:MAG: prolyl oligopeptidase family serine peptidase, partial [Flavobacteriales bacterium]|nr:prolyl oligopeptidase family serine peptidase [Flavobacteriales bacterium]